jgi:hypothetical protein
MKHEVPSTEIGSPAAAFLWGALTAVLGTFPLAVLCALVFRFPVPFGGYMTGPESVIPVLIAVVFYGALFGGFIVQAMLGGVGGLAAQRWGGPDRRRIARLRTMLALLGAAPGVFTLAILDKLIGPW